LQGLAYRTYRLPVVKIYSTYTMEANNKNSSKWNVLSMGLIEGLIRDRLWVSSRFLLWKASDIHKDPNRASLTKLEENGVILVA